MFYNLLRNRDPVERAARVDASVVVGADEHPSYFFTLKAWVVALPLALGKTICRAPHVDLFVVMVAGVTSLARSWTQGWHFCTSNDDVWGSFSIMDNVDLMS